MASLRFKSHAATHVGLVRQRNEDAFVCRDPAGLWAVADGLGGHAAGDVASQAVARHLERVEGSDVAQALDAARGALARANRELNRMDTGPGGAPGTTVALLLIRGNEGAVAWAGDSRIYRLRGGELRQLTRDHSPVQALVDEEIIAPEDANAHPMAHAVTRAVGIEDTLELESAALEVRDGDRYLLCTDGLSRVLSRGELRDLLATADLRQSVESMLKATLDRGAPDNVTIVVVECLSRKEGSEPFSRERP